MKFYETENIVLAFGQMMENLDPVFGSSTWSFWTTITMVINHLLTEMIPQVWVYAMYIQLLTDMLF